MLQPGQKVKISENVYKYHWEGYEGLQNKFGRRELTVDRIVDLRDIKEGVWIIVDYNGIKAKVRQHYLWEIQPEIINHCESRESMQC